MVGSGGVIKKWEESEGGVKSRRVNLSEVVGGRTLLARYGFTPSGGAEF